MKVGDYVRFDYHRVSVPIQIARIIETHYDNEDDSICYSTDVGLVIDESNLVKEPSKNPIDLIKVGDYVNGMLVIEETPKDKRKKQQITVDSTAFEWGTERLFNENIKSIVTKEQFESMEYKVGE